MEKIIRATLADVKPFTPEQIRRFRNIRDEDIDFSDNPEATPEDFASGRVRLVARGGKRINAGRKPAGNKPVTLRLPERTINSIRKLAAKQHKTMSEIVREHLVGV